MKFSVIIATKNRAERLDAALASLALQGNPPPFEIIVVDNGSTDATRSVVQKHRVRYEFEPIPNRARARNRGVAVASGSHLLFVDDDVVVPAGFLALHARAQHDSIFPTAVSGPIVNVAQESDRPAPSAANYSAAFFCTCNVSIRASTLAAVGGFDDRFDLYGWEDTELGVRLRAYDVQRAFVWDAYLWHIKPPHTETLDAALVKVLEKARMAARFVRKSPTTRARLATGAYAANLLRGKALSPRFVQPWLAGMATSPRVPATIARIARKRLLDGFYVDELARALDADR